MIKIGLDGTKKIYIGNNSVTTVYIGTKRVFPQTNLPYDAEIEYLESTGTQWINTNVFANLNTIVELEGAMTTVFNDNVFIGSDEGDSTQNSFVIESYKHLGFLLCLDGVAPCFVSNFSDTNYHHIKASKNYLIIDDSQFSTYEHGVPQSFTSKQPLYMFAWNRGGSVGFYGKVRISYLKIFSDTTLMRDYIPVRKGNVGYMYDKVSGQLFGNSGTGNFILGADKSYGKYKFTLSDSSVVTAECDNSSTITSADTSAYQNSLVQAEIGDCVTSIGDNAFSNYTNLTSITISNTVTNIGYNAFGRCTGLTSVIIPESVTTISSNAFSNCKNLTSINIPSGVTSIGDFAFYGCSNFASITVEATNPPLLGGNYAFGVTNNCPIYVPSGSVDAYKSASGWSTYTDRIQAIS